MFVAAAVLNRGTLWSDEQPLNIPFMFGTVERSNRGTLRSETQFKNILPTVLAGEILNKGTLWSDEQF